MGLFKSEVVVLKDSTASKDYLAKLEALYAIAPPEVKPELEKEIKITQAGIVGEDNIMYELKNSGMDLVVLHDVYIQAGDLSAQIDFFVVSPKNFFLVECKNLYGNIEINSKGDFIRSFSVNGRKVKEGIYSPITQNQRHMEVLRQKRLEGNTLFRKLAVKSGFDLFHKPLVVLANPKTILNDKYAPAEIKNKVIRADQLIKTIRDIDAQRLQTKSSFSDMMIFGNTVLEMCSEYDGFAARYDELEKKVREAQEQHEQQEKAKAEKESKTKEALVTEPTKPDVAPNPAPSPEVLFCPRCGQQLVLRTAKKGDRAGQQFYGCSAYPRCRYIKNL